MTATTIYATPADVRAMPNVTGTASDEILTELLAAASRMIDGYCNRKQDGFVAADDATPRLFTGMGGQGLAVNEFVELDAMRIRTRGSTMGTWRTLSIADVLPYRGSASRPNLDGPPFDGILIVSGESFPDGRDPSDRRRAALPTVEVTARWGYADEVPSVVRSAAIILASRWFKRGQSFWADTTASEGMAVLSFRKSIDPDVVGMLNDARLRRVAYGQ